MSDDGRDRPDVSAVQRLRRSGRQWPTHRYKANGRRSRAKAERRQRRLAADDGGGT